MISYTYQITERNEAAKTVTVVYDPDPTSLPNVTETIPVRNMEPRTIAIAVAQNVPISYWVSCNPSVLPVPTTVEPFVVDPSRQPPVQ